MTLFGFEVPYLVLIVPVALFFGWCFWKLANEGLERPNPNKEWSPDADPRKGETLRNHGPGGMNR